MEINVAIDNVMKELTILANKSNLIFGGEGEDELHPMIVSKHNCKVIPVRSDIISAIEKCKCVISSIDTIIVMITDFIVTVEMDKQFTTKQFMILLCDNHNLLSEFDTSETEMKKWYLNEELINDIDERRQCLTMENLKELSGLKGDKDDGWENDVNWEFVDFMNNNLLNVSIITVPTDSMTLETSKYNVDYKDKFVQNPWNYIHDHLIVGRTERGDIIGYRTQIVWT
eukprot:388876_1